MKTVKKKVKISISDIQKRVIGTISLGNVLEWYDFYLFVFWTSSISDLFLPENPPFHPMVFMMSLFVLGFAARPFGGWYFGRLGDRIGRQKAFMRSLIIMTGSTALMGFLPTYEQVGIIAPILLVILRLGQTFPSGGELPGAFCYLYEADSNNKIFTTSFAGLGNQIGIILAAAECLLLKKLFPEDLLHTIGWRISFFVGGLLGGCGIFLRSHLHETHAFEQLSGHHKIHPTHLKQLVKEYWGRMVRGF